MYDLLHDVGLLLLGGLFGLPIGMWLLMGFVGILDDATWQWLKDAIRPWLWRAGYEWIGMPENKQESFMAVLGAGLPENSSPSVVSESQSESEESDEDRSPAQNSPSIAELSDT